MLSTTKSSDNKRFEPMRSKQRAARAQRWASVRMKLLRWIAVPLASVFAWYATLIVGFVLVGLIPCPAELIVSGACTAWWHSYVVDTFIIIFAGLAAFFVVLCAAVVAPSHKLHVAWLAYGSGCAVALYFVAQSRAVSSAVVGAFIMAVIIGFLAVGRIAKYLGARLLPNKPRQPIAPKDGASVER